MPDWREARHWTGIWLAAFFALAAVAVIVAAFAGVPIYAALLPLALIGGLIWLFEFR